MKSKRSTRIAGIVGAALFAAYALLAAGCTQSVPSPTNPTPGQQQQR
jgi:hypothetical protein